MKQRQSVCLWCGVVLAVTTFSASAQPLRLGPAVELKQQQPVAPVAGGRVTVQDVDPIDTSDRSAVTEAWFDVYVPGNSVQANWTGDLSSCQAGDTDTSYKEATLQRVNYYRAMAGLPGNLTMQETYNAKCREAALMMVAEGALSHSPGTDWSCYSADGKEAAGKSNLALGAAGPAAIRNYMIDFGGSNTRVGHRQWILFPRLTGTGVGSSTGVNGYFHGANALWVADSNVFGSRPAEPAFVAWPPAGYVPYGLVDYSGGGEVFRWSYAEYNADFTNAVVTMTTDGNPVTLTIVYRGTPGYAPDPVLVWEPQGVAGIDPPAAGKTYHVAIAQFTVDGEQATRDYDVTVFDPNDTPPVTPTPMATASPTVPAGGPGDLNQDGYSDHLDLWELARQYTTAGTTADLNDSGQVDQGDLLILVEEQLKTD